MKNILLILLCMTLSAVAFSQHFTDIGNTWLITSLNWKNQDVTTFQVKIDSDTLINSQDYKTLVRSDDAINPIWSRVKFYLREDGEKKVFILDSMGNEGILYHFGLEPGQQVTLWNGVVVTIRSIDSIMVANNKMQRRFQIMAQKFGLSGEHCTTFMEWFDGIGGTSGPLPVKYCPVDSLAYGLGCFYRNENSLVFPAQSNWCQEFVTATPQVDNSVFSVFPNPVTDALNIQFADSSHETKIIHLYSLQGQLLYEKQTADTFNQIDVSSMATGVFILKVITSDGHLLMKKIIKE